jgi:hypothetical protein
MFRIDEHTVCDATKLGNVARYINASCSPNCYTQIITANVNKRIVIYAKKHIKRGEGKYHTNITPEVGFISGFFGLIIISTAFVVRQIERAMLRL